MRPPDAAWLGSGWLSSKPANSTGTSSADSPRRTIRRIGLVGGVIDGRFNRAERVK